LTSGQYVKPLLGSAVAEAVPFGPIRFDGTLVLGSDGLFKYAAVDAIRERCEAPSAGAIARSLIDLVKLPSGDFHDDTTVAVCRYSRD
jgi:PPM family protein phosphatase